MAPTLGQSLDLDGSAELDDPIDHRTVRVGEGRPNLLTGFELPGFIGHLGLPLTEFASVRRRRSAQGPLRLFDRGAARLYVPTGTVPAEDALARCLCAVQRPAVRGLGAEELEVRIADGRVAPAAGTAPQIGEVPFDASQFRADAGELAGYVGRSELS